MCLIFAVAEDDPRKNYARLRKLLASGGSSACRSWNEFASVRPTKNPDVLE
jgi:hypothetical protein